MQQTATGGISAEIPITYPIVLNDRWRVTDDPLQWILERRKRNPSAKGSGI